MEWDAFNSSKSYFCSKAKTDVRFHTAGEVYDLCGNLLYTCKHATQIQVSRSDGLEVSITTGDAPSHRHEQIVSQIGDLRYRIVVGVAALRTVLQLPFTFPANSINDPETPS